MTKNTLFFAALSLLFATSCSQSDQAKIEKNALGYLDAMGNYRIDDAEKYATDETRRITLQFFERQIIPYLEEGYIEKNTPATIEITGVDITSDTSATVSFHKSAPNTEQDGTLNMVKRDGKWQAKVVVKIPDFFKMTETERSSINRIDSIDHNMKLQVLDGPLPIEEIQKQKNRRK